MDGQEAASPDHLKEDSNQGPGRVYAGIPYMVGCRKRRHQAVLAC